LLGVDAGETSCTDAVTADGGGLNACYDCLYTDIPVTGNGPTSWGAYLVVAVEPEVGDVSGQFLVDLGYDVGGCIFASSPSARACGLDIMQFDACSFAVCLPICAVPNPGAGEPIAPEALAALDGCFAATQEGACRAYASAAAIDCAPLKAAGPTGVYARCQALVAEDDGEPDAGAPTEATVAELVGLICGGADAGP
jgi:hypothetical protein